MQEENSSNFSCFSPVGYKQRVSYFYQGEGEIADYYYGPGHPMKPQRLKLTHQLILSYNLFRKMDVFRPSLATSEDLAKFHDAEYVDFLQTITKHNSANFELQMHQFNIGESTDCPIFEGMFDYSCSHAGATIDAAIRLNRNETDIAINWTGGLHHAKKSEASGFCYINDIVLGILELLKYHPRVLYIDIDIHHGDGVEEAFYNTDRVMTLSFHKYGDFFPGSGGIEDMGNERGKYFSVNFPLLEGMDDKSFDRIFKPVVSKAIDVYRPTVLVLQCGADSLTQDRLGCFNLTVKGHAECVRYVKTFNLPTMVLGGGGYTIRNVARCWCYETAVLVNQDQEISENVPWHDYYDSYAPDYSLHIVPSLLENRNTKESLEKTKLQVLAQLSLLECAPSVHMHEVPPDSIVRSEFDPEFADPEKRYDGDSKISGLKRREFPGEWYEPEKMNHNGKS